jgi:hypothetical protein
MSNRKITVIIRNFWRFCNSFLSVKEIERYKAEGDNILNIFKIRIYIA